MVMDASKRIDSVELPKFIFAGDALLTFQSTETNNHFTFRVKQSRKIKALYYVKLLYARNQYRYMGIIQVVKETAFFSLTKKSCVSKDTQSYKVFSWIIAHLSKPEVLNKVLVRHEGICVRCGRALTEPESLEWGFGPHCIKFKNKKPYDG